MPTPPKQTYYSKRVEDGKCPICETPPVPGRTRCAKHLALSSTYTQRYHKRNKQAYNAYMRRYMQRKRAQKAPGSTQAALLARAKELQHALTRTPSAG